MAKKVLKINKSEIRKMVREELQKQKKVIKEEVEMNASFNTENKDLLKSNDTVMDGALLRYTDFIKQLFTLKKNYLATSNATADETQKKEIKAKFEEESKVLEKQIKDTNDAINIALKDVDKIKPNS